MGVSVKTVFKTFFDYSMVRSWEQAILFYIAHIALFIVIMFFLGMIIGPLVYSPVDAENKGLKLGIICTVIFNAYLSTVIIFCKNYTRSKKYILIGILSPLLAFFGGNLLGILPAAYLTTRPLK